tara:strand:- start:149 stop:280 length:132 start_codon:yes stop_codon:yes gene_type:complete
MKTLKKNVRRFCLKMVEANLTPVSGYQGADIIATKSPLKMVFQ